MIAKILWLAGMLLVIANLLLLAIDPEWIPGIVTFACLLICAVTYERTWRT